MSATTEESAGPAQERACAALQDFRDALDDESAVREATAVSKRSGQVIAVRVLFYPDAQSTNAISGAFRRHHVELETAGVDGAGRLIAVYTGGGGGDA